MADSATERVNLLVRKDDWSSDRFEASKIDALLPGAVLFRVDRFALTSNNISYAAAGDMLDYWGFFPAEEGWGRIPAMGFADVIASEHSEVLEGERVFGFFPMATHLTIQAEDVNPAQLVDGAVHRKNHAQAYRQYLKVGADPFYEARREDQIMLLRGLFMTSFLVDGFLADNRGFGAESYLVGSASSKTGIALAFLLSRQQRGRVIGFTSPSNRAFVESLGCYDEVLPYDDVKALPGDAPSVFVDHSGYGDFVGSLHAHLGDSLKYSCVVGATHWNAGPRAAELPGPTPTFFFAPGEIKNRIDAWGAAGFQQRLGDAWRQFCDSSDDWLRIARSHGPTEVERVYQTVLAGQASPSEGHVLSLWETDA
jgi:NADPH:quinone reductase-like Zn-dependent oxidoreductase